jgi:peptide N-acetyl-beta-D-glucosaminyl asparaginase amidase A
MPTFPALRPVRRLALLVFALAFFLFLSPLAQAQNPPLVIGSQNTVTADPPVTPPHEQPCIVQLFSGLQFVDFSIKTYQYTPPAACPGPWEKIVFTADFNVTAGRQFDRTAVINLANVNIYFGTTAEPRHNLAPSWHIERDETDYGALFESAQSGQVILGNIVNSTYTGIISGSATLEFYPAKHERRHDDPARTADQVLPLVQPNGTGGINEPAFLFSPTDQLATTFSLPLNVERAYLDVITQSQIGDEFWYACVPNDVASKVAAPPLFAKRKSASMANPPASPPFTPGFTPAVLIPSSGNRFPPFRP